LFLATDALIWVNEGTITNNHTISGNIF